MSKDNTAVVTGNLTRDPELRFTQSGTARTTFGVAWSQRRKNEQGQWEDGETSFIDCVAWDKLAENLAESAGKGDRVTVTGTIIQRRWENDEGEKRSKVEIKADDVALSLRWATAKATRNEKGSGSSGGSGKPDYAEDEEPF